MLAHNFKKSIISIMNQDRVDRRTCLESIGAAALGLGAALILGPKTVKSEEIIQETLIPQAPNIQTKELPAKIKELDREIYRSPERLEDVIEYLAEIACREVADTLGTDYKMLRDNQHFLSEDAFKKQVYAASACKITHLMDGVIGLVLPDFREAYINIDRIRDPNKDGRFSRRAATNGIGAIVHEANHQANEINTYEIPDRIVYLDGSSQMTNKVQGAAYLVRIENEDKEGRECVGAVFPQIEEGMSEHSTLMSMISMRLPDYEASYIPQVEGYIRGVVNTYMLGDYKELRSIKTKKGIKELFKRVGLSIKLHPRSANDLTLQSIDDELLGKTHMLRVIPPFPKPKTE